MASTFNIEDVQLGAVVSDAWRRLCRSRTFEAFSVAIGRLAAPTLLFGGYPRLLARGEDPLGARDIDIVIAVDRDSLESTVQPWIARRTRFGGLHLAVENQRVDIWTLCDTWAFRERKVELPCSPENLIKTVFLSIDAIAVDIHTNAVYASVYRETLRRAELDIVLRENPYPALCVLRALVFMREYGLRASRRLRRYIQLF